MTGQPLRACTAANEEWALDFVHDTVESGRAIRVLSVVDAYTRECLALEVDTSFASRRVTRVLEEIVAERGMPQAIRCDNGPELTSRHFLAWCMERKIELVHIQPGRPMQNGHVESFNGRMREECLNVSWFWNVFESRGRIAAWRREYNEERPHSSLGYRTPEEFAREAGGEKGCGKGAPWKSKNNFSTALGNPAKGAGFPLSHSPGGDGPPPASKLKVRMSYYEACGVWGQATPIQANSPFSLFLSLLFADRGSHLTGRSASQSLLFPFKVAFCRKTRSCRPERANITWQTSSVCLKRTVGLAICLCFSEAGSGSGVSQTKLNHRFELTALPKY